VARGYRKALSRARSLVYVEDQYLWSPEIARSFAAALERSPDLRMIAVLPAHPDQDGRLSLPPNLLGRQEALDLLRAAGGDRVAVYSIENPEGVPVYVHAKVCVIDDSWACVGSDNANRRSWTHDSELSCAVVDCAEGDDPAGSWARDLRLRLAAEHLGRGSGDEADLQDARGTFDAFGAAAAALDAWHAAGRRGPRPAGRLRTYHQPRLSRFTRWWSTPIYRLAFDPDARSRRERRREQF
jgi:phosphatidylserine/phosphatidylglycerophosphate/cardiolipin synthase-like enzyme